MTLPPAAASEEDRLVPRMLTRSLAILERCRFTPRPPSHQQRWERPRCHDIVVVPRDGVPWVLGESERLLGLDPHREWLAGVRDAMALPGGGAALLLSLRDTYDARVDLVLELDARGAIVRRRGFAWSSREPVSMLARSRRGVGLAVASAGEPQRLTFFGLDPRDSGREAGTVPLSELRACSGREGAARDAITVSTSAPGYAPEVEIGELSLRPGEGLRSEVEFHGDSACLRSVRAWSLVPLEPEEAALPARLGGALQARARGGTLVWTAVDRARDTPLRCRAR
jgi:hypothetical protein